MMPANIDLHINKSFSYYLCCKCATKPVDYYVLTGQNPDSLTEMVPLCKDCYQEQRKQQQQQQQQHQGYKNRRWTYRK